MRKITIKTQKNKKHIIMPQKNQTQTGMQKRPKRYQLLIINQKKQQQQQTKQTTNHKTIKTTTKPQRQIKKPQKQKLQNTKKTNLQNHTRQQTTKLRGGLNMQLRQPRIKRS
jgi:hypothetical protein